MAALALVLALTLAAYHWLAQPQILILTSLFEAGWLPLAGLAVLGWLLAGRR